MKKILYLILLVTIQANYVYSEKVEGQIILKNDTLNVTLNIPKKLLTREINYSRLQDKIKYYDISGGKTILYPDQVVEVRFSYGYEKIRMVSVRRSGDLESIFDSNTHILLKLEVDGNLRMFCYYYYQRSPGTMNASTGTMSGGYSYETDKYIIQKKDGPIKWPKNLTFKKDMMQYFSDCPELVKKIGNKEFKKDQIEMIVRFYNDNCGK